jgi:16S rRNA (guanine527-N7)-methyltransferase
VGFSEELESLLPDDVPHREEIVGKCARHLDLIVEANQHFNLTRITDAREAAIKHVVDSVMPWRLFANAARILDAGTGAGFPGIPLAIVLPTVDFTLCESVGKKARFVESAVKDLGLTNVNVPAKRAEEVLKMKRVDLITARAVAPVSRALELFFSALKQGSRVILYKGRDAEAEIREAEPALRRRRVSARIVDRYELPDSLGARAMVEMTLLHR